MNWRDNGHWSCHFHTEHFISGTYLARVFVFFAVHDREKSVAFAVGV